MNVYSIYDKKARKYDSLMLFDNDNLAKRAIISSLSNQSLLVLYPSDYSLSRVAIFNVTSGSFDCDDVLSFDVVDLIPDKFKQFVLDGSFTNRSGAAGESE